MSLGSGLTNLGRLKEQHDPRNAQLPLQAQKSENFKVNVAIVRKTKKGSDVLRFMLGTDVVFTLHNSDRSQEVHTCG